MCEITEFGTCDRFTVPYVSSMKSTEVEGTQKVMV